MLEVGYVIIYTGFDKTPFCWHFISADCNSYHRFLLLVGGIKPYNIEFDFAQWTCKILGIQHSGA